MDFVKLNEKQLVWRCRRGIRELDVLFTQFRESVYPNLNHQQRLAFQRLLDEQDPIIMDWLFGKSSSEDQELVDIISELKLISGLR